MTGGHDTDVLILGGGPAGSTAAILLAENGIAVRVVDSEQFPRFHVGESLLPASLEMLDRLGVHDRVRALPQTMRKEGATFVTPGGERKVVYWFDEAMPPAVPHAYQVRRDVFDAVLLDRARECGAEVSVGWRAIAPLWDGDRLAGLTVRDDCGEERTLRARVVLDASGQSAFLANRMGWRFPYPRHRKVASFAHYDGVWREEGREAGNITIALTEGGWFWLIPFADGTTSVGAVLDTGIAKRCGGGPGHVLEGAVAATPEVGRRLAGASRLTPVSAIQNFSYRVKHRAGDGYCMIGDAAGFLDPIFSTGVFLATATAESAAQDIVEAFARHRRADGNDFAPTVALTRNLHRLFFAFIRAYYDPNFVPFFFAPRDILGIPAAIVSLLAADVLSPGRWRKTLRFRYLIGLAKLQGVVSRWGASLVDPLPSMPSSGSPR